MGQTIIIPHRDRKVSLAICLRSLALSAEICGEPDHEIIIVDGGSEDFDPADYGCRVIVRPQQRPFNKCALLNCGIDAARGDVLTFLDADAVVAPLFFRAARVLDNPAITKICYRVRRLPLERAEKLRTRRDLESLFADYTSELRREAYGSPDCWTTHRRRRRRGPVFGNSQFSIRAETLGALRYNELYQGHGYEDIAFNLTIWREHYENYRAAMITSRNHALYHIDNPGNFIEGWGIGPWTRQNILRYRQEWGYWKRELRKLGASTTQKRGQQ